MRRLVRWLAFEVPSPRIVVMLYGLNSLLLIVLVIRDAT